MIAHLDSARPACGASRLARRRAAPLLAALAGLVLAGCASPLPPVPDAIRLPPPGDLQLVEANRDPQRHLGTRVRWGGEIIAIEREAQGNSRVQILERRLDEDAQPIPGSASDGRFVIRADPSVDPDLYERGGEVTVAGVLDGTVMALVGDRRAALPVVRVEHFRLWEPRWRGYPYDPYYPYHPYYPYPWYGPHWRFGVGIGHGFHHPHPGYWPYPYGWVY